MRVQYYNYLIFLLLVNCITGCSDENAPLPDKEIAGVANLLLPKDKEILFLSRDLTQSIEFEWEKVEAINGQIPFYEVIFAKENNDFSQPIEAVSAGNAGVNNKVNITHKRLNEIWEKAGIAEGEAGTLSWTVRTTINDISMVADDTRQLTLTRIMGDFEMPATLYLTGEGTESGDDLNNALEFHRLGDGEFILYTKLEAEKDFKIVNSKDKNTSYSFCIEDNHITEGYTGNSVPKTAAYRIYINFNTEEATIDIISRFGVYYNLHSKIIIDLEYVGNGLFVSENDLGYIILTQESWGKEVRYRLMMELTDPAGNTRQLPWGPDPDKPNAASQIYMKEAPNAAQWSDIWDLDRNIDRKNVTVTACLDPEKGFYHFFEEKELHPSFWEEAANKSTASFVAGFWNSRGYFNNNVDGVTVWNDYWPDAHALDVVIDGYVRNGNPSYKTVIYDWYEGTRNKNWGSNNWWNTYFDDMAWHGLTHLRALEATNDKRYEESAGNLWGWILKGWDENEGGGIRWNDLGTADGNGKGVPSNGPSTLIAIRRWVKYGHSEIREGETNLEWAYKIYHWMREYRYEPETGRVFEHKNTTNGDWTYNAGTFLGAAMELYDVTGNRMYFDDAIRTADYALANLINKNHGILSDWAEQYDDDVNLFKAIFIRYFTRLIMHKELPADKQKTYIEFMKHNAQCLWSRATLFEPYTQYNHRWWEKPTRNVVLRTQVSGCTLIEAMALLYKEGYLK